MFTTRSQTSASSSIQGNLVSKNLTLKLIISLVASLLILVFPVKHYLHYLLNHQDTYDFGIYYKAMLEIASGNLNPWIGFRGDKIVNDHVDPIIHILAPFLNFTQSKALALYLIESIFIIFSIFFVSFKQLKKSSTINFLISICLIIFSRGLFSALDYPVHPTTWSALPIAFLIYSMIQRKPKEVFLYALVLCLFKESYPFSLLALTPYFFLMNERKLGAYCLISSLLLLVSIFIFRPMLLGESYNHTAAASRSLIDIFIGFPYLDYLKIIYPLFIPAFLLRKKINLFALIPLILFYLPQIGMHFLLGKVYYHYGVPLALPLVFFVALQMHKVHPSDFKKPLIFLCLVLAILPAFNKHQKNFKNLNELYGSFEKRFDSLKQENKQIEEKLSKIGSEETIFASVGLITRHSNKNNEFYHFSRYAKPLEKYDYLLLATNNEDNTYPYQQKNIQKILQSCLTYRDIVIYESKQYQFWKGPFPKECLEKSN